MVRKTSKISKKMFKKMLKKIMKSRKMTRKFGLGSKKMSKKMLKKIMTMSRKFGSYQDQVNGLTGGLGPTTEANWPYLGDLKNTWSMSSHPLYVAPDGRYISSFEQNSDKLSSNDLGSMFGKKRSRKMKKFGRKKSGCECRFGRKKENKKFLKFIHKRSYKRLHAFGCNCGSPKII